MTLPLRALLLTALLAGCAPAPQPSHPADAPASGLSGVFVATSTTAMGVTGDIAVGSGTLTFGKGFTLFTEPAGPVDVTTLVRRDGESFAQTMTLPTSVAIELRRVTRVEAGAGVETPCGETAPTFVALAWDTPPSAVGMAVFSGAQAPGPDATDTALCGTFSYAK